MGTEAIRIRKAGPRDVDAVAALYDELNDYLSKHVNYPGWRRGVYPTREDAEAGAQEDALFVAEADGELAGTFILRHRPEEAYARADWHVELDYAQILVLYTFAVHPAFLRRGVGRAIMDYVVRFAADAGMKAVRLDVYENNLPAIRLYESCGFDYIGSVDLGYSQYGLDSYRLYQRLL